MPRIAPKLKYRFPRFVLAFLLGSGVVTVHPASRLLAASNDGGQAAQKATLKSASAHPSDIPFPDPEFPVEQRLVELANQSRQQAGVSPLTLDSGLSHAALIHAQAMVDARQLSHQFEGEPSLPQRLADRTLLQLDQEGENVALDFNAEDGHQHLMQSPPHRANLLNPAYNVVGLGVVRSGDRLYIVEDFGHALPSYSPTEVKQRVAGALNDVRQQNKMPELALKESSDVSDAACSMAQADKLGTPPVRNLAQRATTMSYTSLRPEVLPTGAAHAITGRSLHSASVGACYSRTDTYPTGVYWVVVTLE